MTGSQEPRLRVEPQRIASDGGDAADLMAAYGATLDPWQRLVLDCWLGYDLERKYTVTSAGLSVPRQNGKNVILEGREFFGMVISGEKILHTAHQVRTSKKAFRRLVALFTDKRHPEIMELVKQIRFTNGEECIELTNGGTVEYSARSSQAARGFDGISLVVFDEAQELTDDQIDAILPTLSASATGTRQIIYTGTPPYPGCPGDVFRRRREAALTDPSPHDCWHEWSVAAKTLEEIRLGDRTLWAATNPSMGLHLSEEFTAEELTSMAADGFARERLGWWTPREEHKLDLAIPAKTWDACASAEPKPEGKTAFGVKFTQDGSEVCLCGAVIPAEGKARITLIARQPTGIGTGWLAVSAVRQRQLRGDRRKKRRRRADGQARGGLEGQGQRDPAQRKRGLRGGQHAAGRAAGADGDLVQGAAGAAGERPQRHPAAHQRRLGLRGREQRAH